MKNSLTEIISFLKPELSEFNLHFKNAIRSDVRFVNLITNYLIRQKGKKIRPLLVILSSKLISGEINERVLRGAALVELLHTATLVHDDVVDDSKKRRGLPSINYIWKNKIAVLLGDYLLAKGLLLAVDNEDFDFLKIVSETVKRMSEGELLQIKKTKRLNNDEDTYFRIISDKTASLLSTCCEIGAKSVTENNDEITALKNFGEYLGIAFQIRDDILDYVGTSAFGKSVGNDIKEKKLTLPLIFALGKSDKKIKEKILKDIRKSRNIKEVISFVIDKGGIEYADKVAKEYAEKAKLELKIFKNRKEKEALFNIVDYVTYRKK